MVKNPRPPINHQLLTNEFSLSVELWMNALRSE
jgi:hypothetical protein